MINLSIRDYQLIIDGIDCTKAAISIDGNSAHYDQKGYQEISANITLRHTIGFGESLDDRTNVHWQRGKIIRIKVSKEDSTTLEYCPVLGYLYILNARYDGIKELKIEAGCILHLLGFRSPAGDGACFDLGTTLSLNAIAEKLLIKAGVPSYNVNISGNPLIVSLPKMSNESYINLFGKLCWVNGYLAYQDELGIVQTKPINVTPTTSIISLEVGKHESRYEPLTSAESPSEILKVTGEIKKIRNLDNIPQTTQTSELFGTIKLSNGDYYTGLIGKTIESTDEINAAKRTITSNFSTMKTPAEVMPGVLTYESILIFSEIKDTIRYYEKKPVVPVNYCFNPDEGRLLKVTEITQEPYRVALKKYVEARLSFDENLIFPATDLIISKKVTTTYFYDPIIIANDPSFTEPDPCYSKLGKFRKVTEIYQTTGSLYYDLRSENDDLALPTALVLSEYKEENYTEVQRNKWKLETINQKAWVLINESDVFAYRDELENNNILVFPDIYWQLKDSEPRTSSVSYTANQPPAPERFSKTKEIYECPVKEKVYFPSFAGLYKDRIKELSVDSGLLTSKAQAQNLGKIEGLINWGKWKGNTCTTVLWDEFFSVSPLDPVDWIESTGLTHRFLIDGFAIAITGKRCAISFDGIWIAKIGEENITPARDAMGLPSFIALEGGDSEFGSIRVLPYSLSNSVEITGINEHFGSIGVVPYGLTGAIVIDGINENFGSISVDAPSWIVVEGENNEFGIVITDPNLLITIAGINENFGNITAIAGSIIITGINENFGNITAIEDIPYQRLTIEKQSKISLFPNYQQLTIEKQSKISLFPNYQQLTIEKQDYISLS